jgi:hypothetical protein
MQLDATAVAARNWTVPAHGADHDQSQPVPYAKLAERLATHGIGALQNELRRLIRDAHRHGVRPLLVTILADSAQPDVARQRAFGRILAELERPHESRPHPARTAIEGASVSVTHELLPDTVATEQRARMTPRLLAQTAALGMSSWTSTVDCRRRQHALPFPASESCGRHRPPRRPDARTRREP